MDEIETMANTRLGRILPRLGVAMTLAVLSAPRSVIAGPARSLIEPQNVIVAELTAHDTSADARSLENAISDAATSAPTPLPGSGPNATFRDQPPMIPLPPAVWAGMIGLAGVAWRTVRATRR